MPVEELRMPISKLADALFKDARVLVVAPHPDDETFGCGGTIARAKALGAEVYVMVVSAANLVHYSTEFQHVSGRQRISEFHLAMETLGVDGTDVLYTDDHIHMRVDVLPRRDLVARIERDSPIALDRLRPDVLLFPAISYNQDHEAVYKAIYAACRPHLPTDKPFCRLVLSYDQPQLTWNHSPFHPNFYIDISDYLDKKLAAYRCHVSQVRPEPHHASVENVERPARMRGSEVSLTAAEAFECHRFLI
jgi:LmbE family N-acetylglucosaminyl deacetylase